MEEIFKVELQSNVYDLGLTSCFKDSTSEENYADSLEEVLQHIEFFTGQYVFSFELGKQDIVSVIKIDLYDYEKDVEPWLKEFYNDHRKQTALYERLIYAIDFLNNELAKNRHLFLPENPQDNMAMYEDKTLYINSMLTEDIEYTPVIVQKPQDIDWKSFEY